MAYREVTRVEIQEIIRRWQAGEGYRLDDAWFEGAKTT